MSNGSKNSKIILDTNRSPKKSKTGPEITANITPQPVMGFVEWSDTKVLAF